MRRVLASAMLCLLLLLSVGVVRCEAQCAFSAMPMAMQPLSPSSDSAMAMDSGMEHCDGMQAVPENMPMLDAACGVSTCRHQAVPSTSDSQIDFDRAHTLQPVVVQIASAIVVQSYALRGDCEHPPSLQRSPLSQSSSLRV